jgi:hypothetical protein
MTSSDDDSALLSRMQAADPASSLPPAGDDRVAQLLEAAMSDTQLHTTESRETGTRDRGPLTWLVAAAAVVLIAAAGVFALANHDVKHAPSAQPSVTQLSVAPASGRCILANVGVLKAQTVAFRGTLTTLADGTATFAVSHWYRGGPTDVAKVVAPQSLLRPLVESARFKVGDDYLVSAHDGQVTACGYSGPASGPLASLYSQAYAG